MGISQLPPYPNTSTRVLLQTRLLCSLIPHMYSIWGEHIKKLNLTFLTFSFPVLPYIQIPKQVWNVIIVWKPFLIVYITHFSGEQHIFEEFLVFHLICITKSLELLYNYVSTSVILFLYLGIRMIGNKQSLQNVGGK